MLHIIAREKSNSLETMTRVSINIQYDKKYSSYVLCWLDCIFLLGDFLNLDMKDWRDGDVVFANSTCYDDNLMEKISKIAGIFLCLLIGLIGRGVGAGCWSDWSGCWSLTHWVFVFSGNEEGLIFY